MYARRGICSHPTLHIGKAQSFASLTFLFPTSASTRTSSAIPHSYSLLPKIYPLISLEFLLLPDFAPFQFRILTHFFPSRSCDILGCFLLLPSFAPHISVFVVCMFCCVSTGRMQHRNHPDSSTASTYKAAQEGAHRSTAGNTRIRRGCQGARRGQNVAQLS